MTTGRINQVDTSQYRNEADAAVSGARVAQSHPRARRSAY